MLPKSSSRVARVIKIAHQIAREDEQDFVGTEHVLIAILREGTGIGAQVLANRGVTLESLRAAVRKLAKKQLEETWVFGRLPGTPHFKNVVATAVEECQKLKSKEVCTEHLLLALLDERGCTAKKALDELGLSLDGLRRDVTELSRAAQT